MNLLNRVQVQASDLFTDEDVTAALNDFPNTETAAKGQGKVVP